MSLKNKIVIEKKAYPLEHLPSFKKHALDFEIHAKCGNARCGTLTLPHGPCRTPMFMPFVFYFECSIVFPHIIRNHQLFFF